MGIDWALLPRGERYVRSWPLHAAVAQPFRDTALIRIWRASVWLAPGTAVLGLWWQLQAGSAPLSASSLGLAALLASLPLQLLLVLGWRASQPLAAADARWLRQLHARLEEAGVNMRPLARHPSYQDLALGLAAFASEWKERRD